MKTSSAKQKGRRLQQEVVTKILKNFPTLSEDDVTSRSMGAPGTDILLSPEAQKVFPFAIECKNQENLNVWKMMEQAEANSPIIERTINIMGRTVTARKQEKVPLGIFHRNNSKTYAVMDLDYLIMLMRSFKDLKDSNKE